MRPPRPVRPWRDDDHVPAAAPAAAAVIEAGPCVGRAAVDCAHRDRRRVRLRAKFHGPVRPRRRERHRQEPEHPVAAHGVHGAGRSRPRRPSDREPVVRAELRAGARTTRATRSRRPRRGIRLDAWDVLYRNLWGYHAANLAIHLMAALAALRHRAADVAGPRLRRAHRQRRAAAGARDRAALGRPSAQHGLP